MTTDQQFDAAAAGTDWDDEAGYKPFPATVAYAKEILAMVRADHKESSREWYDPAICALPDGGVHLSWLVARNHLTLTFYRPPMAIKCAYKLQGLPARIDEIDYSHAMRIWARLLWVFTDPS